MARLEQLELQIVASTNNGATRGVKNLANALESLSQAAIHAEQVNSVAVALGRLSDATRDIGNVPGNIRKIGTALKHFAESVTSTVGISDSLNKVAEAIANIANAGNGLTGVGANIRDIANASARASSAATSEIPIGGTGLVDSAQEAIEKVRDTGSAAKEASKHLVSFTDVVYSAIQGVGRLGIAAVELTGKGFVKLGQGIFEAGKKLATVGWESVANRVHKLTGAVGNLFHSFVRIAMYRALRTAIKAITSGFSQGIEHLYQWSALVGDRFKSSMDSIATSAHYLRDSLGAMASPLIDALAPAIEFVVDKFVSLLNVVNQFIATFTGAKTWRRAVRTPTEYASGMDEAAKSTKKATEAQKKLNKALMDFDEIHLITTSMTGGSNPSSPSGGNGASGIDSTHFVEEPVADWIQAIKDAIDRGDWYGAGAMLADKLNSIIDNWDAKAWGQALGKKIENGLKFFLGFMDNFNWENLGAKIGQALGGIFDEVRAEDIGNAIIAPLKAGVKLAKGFFNEPGTKQAFEEMGVAAATAINGIFNKDFAEDVASAISGALNDGIAFLKTMLVGKDEWIFNEELGYEVKISRGGINWGDVGKNLMKSLFDTIGNINWSDLGTIAANIFTGLVTAIGEGISYAATHIDQIAGAIKDFAMAFFKGIWEWFWPSVKEFLFGEHYTAESANDRPNAPVVTGQGAQSPEQFQQEMTSAGQGLQETYGTLSGIAGVWEGLNKTPLNLKVNDTDGKLKASSVSATNLNTQTGRWNNKTFPFTVTDKNNGLKNSSSYSSKVWSVLKEVNGKKYSFTVTSSGLSTTKSNLKAVEDYLNGIAKMNGKKVKMTVEVSGKGTSGEKVVVNNYMGTKLTAYAGGGFPLKGDLFLANEQGPELIGTINGQPAVASNKEITGISDAVRETGANEAALLREQNSLLRQLLAKKTDVTLAPNVAAGKWVAQSQAAYARASGG